MHMGMSMGMRQEQRLEQRCEQRMELRLIQAMRPPRNQEWQEPDPVKETFYAEGKAVVEIAEDELVSYANGCKNIAQVITDENPDVIMVSMRGAFPVARSVDHFTQKQIPKIYAKTSYFLHGLGRQVNRAFKQVAEQKAKKVLMIDTSVTGKKLSWFLPQMLEDLQANYKSELDVVTAVLWHNREGWSEKTEKDYSHIRNRNYNVGVKNLICEDSPTLLGTGYTPDDCRDVALEMIAACEVPHNADIHLVQKGGSKIKHLLKNNGKIGSTADLFVDLVKKYG
jgi:hypoxanthine phosphoribosyltransferase